MPKKEMTIEDLALLVKKGFDHTAGKEETKNLRDELRDVRKEVDRRFVEMTQAIGQLAKSTDDNFRHVNARLDLIRHDISDMPTMREELHDLRTRVEMIERRVKSLK